GELSAAGIQPRIDSARRLYDLPFFRRLLRLVRDEGIEVIHSHLFGPTVEAGIVGMLTGVPVVGTIHGQGDLSPRERLKALKFGLIRRGVSRLVFVSDSLRDSFLAEGPFPRERTAVIPNGVDPRRHEGLDRAAARAELGVPEDAFLVGALGNLRPVKRYDLFLEAAALLRQRSPDYRFVIVGQTPPQLHGELLALRDRLGLADVVQFTGFRSDAERLLAAMDLFTVTSDSEGFSIATVQAMVSRLPVVATRCGGPEEILEYGRTGVLVHTGSAREIADAIETLRREPARRASLGEAARHAAIERYSLAAQIRAYEGLYEQVIAERGRRKTRVASSEMRPVDRAEATDEPSDVEQQGSAVEVDTLAAAPRS